MYNIGHSGTHVSRCIPFHIIRPLLVAVMGQIISYMYEEPKLSSCANLRVITVEVTFLIVRSSLYCNLTVQQSVLGARCQADLRLFWQLDLYLCYMVAIAIRHRLLTRIVIRHVHTHTVSIIVHLP